MIEESTPEQNDKKALINFLEMNTCSDQKSGSIELGDNESTFDRRWSQRHNALEIIDKGKLPYISKKNPNYQIEKSDCECKENPNDVMSPSWNTHIANEENSNPNKQNATSSKLSRYEQIKRKLKGSKFPKLFSGIRESIEIKNKQAALSSNTVDCRNKRHKGKENSINARNITFSKSEQNSTAKSSCSVSNNNKLNKLEQLYNELSMLENSL